MRIPKGHTPIVNHNNFTDARPTIGSKSTTYNPGSSDAPLAKGAPRYVNPPGVKTKSVTSDSSLSNKRY